MFFGRRDSGNVLFLILIAVSLFAALSYVATASFRGVGGDAPSENATITSSEITQYSGALKNAIMRLLVPNICDPTEISFEAPPFDGSDSDYVNANSPANFSCHVFHPLGGRVSRRLPPQDSNDGRDWAYVETRVMGIGPDQTACDTSCHDILVVLGGIKKSVCEKINEKMAGTTTIVQQDNGADYEDKKYTGTFNSGADIDGTGVDGKHELCIQDTNGVYYYYSVLIPQ